MYNDSYDAQTDAWDTSRDRFGTARIDHTIENISIDGESRDYPAHSDTTNLTATWPSMASAIRDHIIDMFISIESGVGTEDALMNLQIVHSPKLRKLIPRSSTTIAGHYYIPSKSSVPFRYGRIEFHRS